MNDLWTWRVLYRDGGEMSEYDELGQEHSFREADAHRVATVLLLPAQSDQNCYSMTIPEGASPRFFRRRSIHVRSDGEEADRYVIHCVGWERDDSADYLFVHEDGTTVRSPDLNAV